MVLTPSSLPLVGENGTRRPPRPRIELVTEPASEEEAAAIVAGLERFLAETATVTASTRASQSAWQRAALREGVAARDIGGLRWGPGPG